MGRKAVRWSASVSQERVFKWWTSGAFLKAGFRFRRAYKPLKIFGMAEDEREVAWAYELLRRGAKEGSSFGGRWKGCPDLERNRVGCVAGTSDDQDLSIESVCEVCEGVGGVRASAGARSVTALLCGVAQGSDRSVCGPEQWGDGAAVKCSGTIESLVKGGGGACASEEARFALALIFGEAQGSDWSVRGPEQWGDGATVMYCGTRESAIESGASVGRNCAEMGQR